VESLANLSVLYHKIRQIYAPVISGDNQVGIVTRLRIGQESNFSSFAEMGKKYLSSVL